MIDGDGSTSDALDDQFRRAAGAGPQHREPGAHRLGADVREPLAGRGQEQRIGRIDRIGQEAKVVLVSNLYLTGTIEGRPVAKGDEPSAPVSIATPEFFRTLDIPLLSGRAFLPTDDSKSPAVVVVNQAFARKYFPGEDPVGKRMKPGLGDGITNSVVREIVGVVLADPLMT